MMMDRLVAVYSELAKVHIHNPICQQYLSTMSVNPAPTLMQFDLYFMQISASIARIFCHWFYWHVGFISKLTEQPKRHGQRT